MDLVRFTRELVDIDSTTGREHDVADFLLRRLAELDWRTTAMPVEGQRCNVYATPHQVEKPELVFSTHLDTVPPYFASREDGERIYGRGACDAKGILAAQVAAATRLRDQGAAVGLLFLVGEERDSAGARVANQHSPHPRFNINGEPTENALAKASKGSLRLDVIAEGRMAHSAYPELGESAIARLVRALSRILAMPLPQDPDIGPCTLNIGMIEGGRAPNVIADQARATLLYRLVTSGDELKREIEAAVAPDARAEFRLHMPPVRLRSFADLPSMIAAFTTDIPSLTAWGEPLLMGPGSIHVAHTEQEHVEKAQLTAAVERYTDVATRLLRS